MEEQKGELCPKCKEQYLNPKKVLNALSRRDNKTYICTSCGMVEAMEDLYNSGK